MVKRCFRFAFLPFVLSVPQILLAQHGEPAVAGDSAAPTGSTIVPLPAFFYMPETEFGFGVAASYFMYGHEQRVERVLPSSISFLGIYTTRKQTVLQAATDLYLRGGRMHALAAGGYSRFPAKYWGIGNDTQDSLEEDYTPDVYNVGGEIQWQVRDGWYVGALAQFAWRSLVEICRVPEPSLLEASKFRPPIRSGVNSNSR